MSNNNSIDLSLKLSDSVHKISERSRNSVLKGAPCFIWDKELQRTTEPYFNKNFKEGFNKPPNEVNFMRGLGPNRGNLRNKVHIQRVTRVQEIFHMKTSNRSLKSFTEDPRLVNCYVRKLKKYPSNVYMKLPNMNIKAELKNICTKVILADNIDTPSPSEQSDILVDKDMAGRKILNKQAIQEKLNMNKRLLDKMSSNNNLSNTDENLSFREWAMLEREKYKLRTLTDILKKEKKRLDSDSSSSSTASNESLTTNTVTTNEDTIKEKEGIATRKRRRRRKLIPNIRGYMYGKFTKIPKPDKMMKSQDKFGIPNSMIERAAVIDEQNRIKKKQLRHERLKHMSMPLFFSSSDDVTRTYDDDVYDDVKTLSLVRTPYFLVPKIKTKKCKRVERLRSKFLKDERLRRITMLLYDRSVSQDSHLAGGTDHNGELLPLTADSSKAGSKKSLSRQATLTSKQPETPLNDNLSEFQRGYKQFMRDKYNEHKHKIEEENVKLVTFNEFKQTEQEEQNKDVVSSTQKSIDHQLLLQKDIKKMSQLNSDSLITNANSQEAQLQLKRKINYRLSRYDEYVGPFYIDPELCEKFREPKKFKRYSKYYASLMRGKAGIRNRLQVNMPEFEEEQLGEKDKYYHRLCTEWDDYYIHELRNRPPTRKFCVKTDILNLRDQTRDRFMIHYIQENVLNLVKQDKDEKRNLDNIDKYFNDCEPIIKTIKDDAYNKIVNLNELIKPIQKSIIEVTTSKNDLTNKINGLTEEMLEIEKHWDKLMLMQNYYYLLMDPKWRLENDWIHCDAKGKLIPLQNALKNCTTKFIRPKTSHNSPYDIRDFFTNNILSNIERMKSVVPDIELIKNSVDNLRFKSSGFLKQYNDIVWISDIVNFKHKNFVEKFPQFSNYYKCILQYNQGNLDFLVNRRNFLKDEINKIQKVELKKCIKDPYMRKTSAICDLLYRKIIPEIQQDNEITKTMNANEKFGIVHSYVLNLLQQTDNIAVRIVHESEKEARFQRRFLYKEALKARILQNRFKLLTRQLKNHCNL